MTNGSSQLLFKDDSDNETKVAPYKLNGTSGRNWDKPNFRRDTSVKNEYIQIDVNWFKFYYVSI
jgi:hypothetical protein